MRWEQTNLPLNSPAAYIRDAEKCASSGIAIDGARDYGFNTFKIKKNGQWTLVVTLPGTAGLSSQQIEDQHSIPLEHDGLAIDTIVQEISTMGPLPDRIPVIIVGTGAGALLAHELVKDFEDKINITDVISVGYRPINFYYGLESRTKFTYVDPEIGDESDATTSSKSETYENIDIFSDSRFSRFLPDYSLGDEAYLGLWGHTSV
jgi:hypothetical protein